MKRRILSTLLLAGLLLAVIAGSVAAAVTYRFQVEKTVVNYYVNQDGTTSVEYFFTFVNDASADPIDYVDVGVPNSTYEMDGIVGDVDGKPITDIQKSEYVKPGVAFGLGANAIQPGQRGTVHVWIPIINKAIFPSNKSGEQDYASVQFMPTYFDSSLVYGSTDMTVTIILPPGMTTDQPRYYEPQDWPGASQPQSGTTDDNRVYYTWQSADADSESKYTFGAGFPATLVPAAAITQPPAIDTSNFDPTILCCFGFAALFAGIIFIGARSAQKRKLSYLPPKIMVEGNGIKRGLTPVEAGILMEQPMDKILTMVLFSTVKKGAARVEKRDPLTIGVAQPLPEGLQPYELDFVQAFQTADSGARKRKLQDVMVGLVKSVTEKMKGFSRKETVAYYDSIMKQAWAQVEAANTPEVKSQKYEEVMDWTMLDKDYGDRTRTVFGNGPVFLPRWWGNYDPAYRPAGFGASGGQVSGSGGGSSGGGGSFSMPTLPGADFAASMVNGVQNFSAGVLGNLTGFTGGVTDRTNPPPPPPSRSSFGGGSGGHSCACACACAGCACACAGGGR